MPSKGNTVGQDSHYDMIEAASLAGTSATDAAAVCRWEKNIAFKHYDSITLQGSEAATATLSHHQWKSRMPEPSGQRAYQQPTAVGESKFSGGRDIHIHEREVKRQR